MSLQSRNLDATGGPQAEQNHSSMDYTVLPGKSKNGICSTEAPHDAAPNLSQLPIFQLQSQDDALDENAAINSPEGLPDDALDRLKIFYQNVRGLRTKIDDFFLAAIEAEHDVIVLTETWLNDQIISSQLFGNLYNVYRVDRSAASSEKERGGGVLVAVARRLSSHKIRLQVCDEIEQVWVCITASGRNICVGAVYLSPDNAIDVQCINKLIESVSAIVNCLDHCDYHLLFGDFNQPLLSWKKNSTLHMYPDPMISTFSRSSSTLIDGMSLLDLKQMNAVTNSRNRILDLVFVNDLTAPECIVDEAVEALVKPDDFHPALLVTLKCPVTISFVDLVETNQLNFRKTDLTSLNHALQLIDWSPLYDAPDVDIAVEFLISTMNLLFRTYVPVQHTSAYLPWSNQLLRGLKRERARALRQYKADRSAGTKRVFTEASNAYKNYNRQLYSLHVKKTENDLKHHPKRFWSFINSKRKESGLPSSMFLQDEVASTPEGLSNLFARNFSSVFNCETISYDEVSDALLNVPKNVLDMCNISFSADQVKSAIAKLKSSWQIGPDGIPPAILKKCADVLCEPLMAICNKSMTQSKFPEVWKRSVMFPVFKKGDKQDVTNYRGITSLCAGSKLLEILVGTVLFNEAKQYISYDQHGFYSGRSTSTSLTEFTSFCIRHMDRGLQVDTVYTDLKAAFDRVDHHLLLAKVQHMGAGNSFVRWLESYLTNRRLSVKLGDIESYSFCNQSGVPQGSNLGPLLFSLFFNDVCLVLPPGCRILYADDLKIFLVIRSLDDCLELQRLANIFVNWCSRNRLLISVKKCAVISFTRKKSTIDWHYTFCDEPLERVTSMKDLGVLLDSGLTFRKHYSSIIAKANKILGFLIR